MTLFQKIQGGRYQKWIHIHLLGAPRVFNFRDLAGKVFAIAHVSLPTGE